MRKALPLAALLLASAFLAAPARAADHAALVAGVEQFLRDDEKAMLAAILADPKVSARFDAEAPLALADQKNALTPFLNVWRSRLVDFAAADGQRPNPDLEASYGNYAEMLTPQMRAFLVRRLKTQTMPEDKKNDLIGYLNKINDALNSNDHKLTWYTKLVVKGIMDQYRQDLVAYTGTPIAQSAKREAPAATQTLALLLQRQQDANRVANAPAPKPAGPPAPKPPVVPGPPPAEPPASDGGSVAANPTSGGALQQAQQAAQDGQNAAGAGTAEGAATQAGSAFNGGNAANPPAGGGTVIAPAGGGSGSRPGSTLTPAAPGVKPSSDLGAAPPPNPDDLSFMDQLAKMQTKPAEKPALVKYGPTAAGAVIGGLIGLAGGPVGVLVGAVLGGVLGNIFGNSLFH
jgi:hypothetical protein